MGSCRPSGNGRRECLVMSGTPRIRVAKEKILYHGNPHGFKGGEQEAWSKEFKRFRTPAWFAESKEEAESYGEVRPFRIRLGKVKKVSTNDDIVPTKGFDTVMAREEKGRAIYLVMKPNQIKPIVQTKSSSTVKLKGDSGGQGGRWITVRGHHVFVKG